MKTVFNKETREELIARINSLTDKNQAQWGKMNVYQMVRHCTLWEEMIHHNKKYKRPFIGRLLGRFFLKSEMTDKPMRKNNPGIPELIINELNGDLTLAKKEWVALLNDYSQYAYPDNSFVHPFFGKMTKDQIGFFAYRHNDHHLRQFNC